MKKKYQHLSIHAYHNIDKANQNMLQSFKQKKKNIVPVIPSLC